ncbi:MAG: DUF6262 family protein [Chloroflexota bacterium]|nr:DUF6262 family protein [Chloroflexota bacterium]
MPDQQQTKRTKPALLDKVQAAIAVLHEGDEEVTFPAIAHAVGVARSTLYRNPSVRGLVAAAKQKVEVEGADIISLRSILEQIRHSLDEVKQILDCLVERHRGAD